MTASNRLDGKVAIVTGGGRGLGRAMALGLATAGARVTVTSTRMPDEIAAVAKEAGGASNMLSIVADVARPEDCLRVVAETERRFGPVDILVNNAGRGMRFVSERFMTEPTRFWETDPDVWRQVIDTNVNGPFLMARAVTAGMIARGWGRIVNISMNHDTMRRKGFSPYGPSKAALESETIIWSQELSGMGVTVNALLPGGVSRTGMVPDGLPATIKLLPPEVMVPPLLWLMSDAAGTVTGRRFNAAKWDATLDPSAASAAADESAGWPLPN